MPGIRLSVVFARDETQKKLQIALNGAGYEVFSTHASGTDALRRLRMSPPDIVVVDYALPDCNGLKLCTILCEENVCACVLAAPQTEKARCEAELDLYAAEVLAKPVKREELLMAVEVLRKSLDKIKRLEKEVRRLKEAAKARIFVDVAKGLIMKAGVDEHTAYAAMRRASMDLRMPLKDIAQKIIDGRLKWEDINN